MRRRNTRWIVTMNGRVARLVRCWQSEGRWRAERVAELSNPWEDYHEQHRPEALARGRGDSSRADGFSLAARGHEGEEMERRFARSLIDWIETAMDRHEIEVLDLYGPPRRLGVIRKRLPISLLGRIREHGEDLMRVPTTQLPEHAAVASALATAWTPERSA